MLKVKKMEISMAISAKEFGCCVSKLRIKKSV